MARAHDRLPRRRRPGGRLGAQEVETLALFARPAAIAIANAWRYEDERQRADRMALVARVARLVTADLRLDELLQRAADAIHELLGFPNLAIPLIDPEQPGMLVLSVKGGHYKQRIPGEYRIPITTGLMGEAARTRRTVLVNDVTADPRYLPTPGGAPARAELAVPILLGDRVLGVVNVERDEPFSDEDAAIVGIIADQLAVAIENARLYASAQQVAVLEERQRLARELHDAVTQHLSSLTLMAQTLGPAYGRGPRGGREPRAPGGGAEPGGAGRDARAARRAPSQGARQATAAPRPKRRRDRPGRGFGTTGWRRRWRCSPATSRATRCPWRRTSRSYVPRPLAEEEALYRIAQEALSNVVKHAGATYVQLQLATDGRATVLTHHRRRQGLHHVGRADRRARRADGRARPPDDARAGDRDRRDDPHRLRGSGRGTTIEVMVPPEPELRS